MRPIRNDNASASWNSRVRILRVCTYLPTILVTPITDSEHMQRYAYIRTDGAQTLFDVSTRCPNWPLLSPCQGFEWEADLTDTVIESFIILSPGLSCSDMSPIHYNCPAIYEIGNTWKNINHTSLENTEFDLLLSVADLAVVCSGPQGNFRNQDARMK